MNFKFIPGFPNYRFCIVTLQVKSLERKATTGSGNCAREERILKPIKNKCGYYYFNLCNKGNTKVLLRSHISWLVHYKRLPLKPLQIDHKDNNKTNDFVWNLQALTPRENISKAYRQNNRALPTGVSYHKATGKLRAQCSSNGKRKHLGYFKTIEDAKLAYQNELQNILNN